ncbi:MAG: HEAT repeat domain-containing protein [Bryobacteraceae bacterium]|nr:HEAT repeat domain-containing protein [Bryobacteraceae bacterium]
MKQFDWGRDPKFLEPITAAIVAAQKDETARKSLEVRLLEVLQGPTPRGGKDYVFRQLLLVGSPASVPALAALLANQELSHMARYVLERMGSPEAGTALRDALPKVSGPLKVGVISSLGARQDAESIPALAALLSDGDAQVARAAALALGSIRSAEAAKALADAKPADAAKAVVVDARLACAEALLAGGNRAEALTIYKAYVGADQSKQVRLAATRGMLACAGKKE